MGCDIHITIQVQDGLNWQEVLWQSTPYDFKGAPKIVEGIPVAPKGFDGRNYDLFAVLANVRNGRGFVGVETGSGWPSIAPDRGLPPGFDITVSANPQYPEDGPRYMGDHSFTWVGLDELKAFNWDHIEAWQYGVVPANVFEQLTAEGKTPTEYCGGVMGKGIITYEPDEYKTAKANGTLCPTPMVRMGWGETAREATGDWPGRIIPWLDSIAKGCPLRLVLSFDS